MRMPAIFHQYTPAELYIGIGQPAIVTAENSSETPSTGFRATGCAFLDAFVGNLHNHGAHTTSYHAVLLGITPTELCFTLITLTGMTFTDFTTSYILLMAKDLMKDKKNDLKHISQCLGFGSYSGFYRFYMRNVKQMPKWR